MSDLIPLEAIASRIYQIRGTKVMLDRDLAELYGVDVRTLKQAVSRNIRRFPEDFMFELNKEEKRFFKITNCDLKKQGTACEISAHGLYRTGRNYKNRMENAECRMKRT